MFCHNIIDYGWTWSLTLAFIYMFFFAQPTSSPRGLMDKALDFGSQVWEAAQVRILCMLRPNATSSVKIDFRTKMMLLLCNKMIAHIISAFSMIIKKLGKTKNVFRY